MVYTICLHSCIQVLKCIVYACVIHVLLVDALKVFIFLKGLHRFQFRFLGHLFRGDRVASVESPTNWPTASVQMPPSRHHRATAGQVSIMLRVVAIHFRQHNTCHTQLQTIRLQIAIICSWLLQTNAFKKVVLIYMFIYTASKFN